MSLIKVNTIQNANGTTALTIAANGQLSRVNTAIISDGTNSTSATNVIQGSAKAWGRFNSLSGTPVIAASYNVSSITRASAGNYTVNLTNALTDTNYSVVGASSGDGAYNSICFMPFTNGSSQIAPTTTAVTLSVVQATTAIVDTAYVSFALFR